MAALGQRIKAGRAARGMLQSEVAHEAGISVSYLCKIEIGKECPAEETIVAIAEVLNLNPDELLLAAGRMPSDVMARLQADPDLGLAFLRHIRTQPPGVLGIAHHR